MGIPEYSNDVQRGDRDSLRRMAVRDGLRSSETELPQHRCLWATRSCGVCEQVRRASSEGLEPGGTPQGGAIGGAVRRQPARFTERPSGKHDWAVFLTTDRHLEPQPILELYALRWAIEVFARRPSNISASSRNNRTSTPPMSLRFI